MGKKEIKEKLDNHSTWLIYYGAMFFIIALVGAVLIANLYDRTYDSQGIIENSLEVIGNLQEEGWALTLICIDWESDYCNELSAYNMSGTVVYQPRGTFETDCNRYCVEESVRRVKLTLS